jgi:hypothetical protein
MHPAIGTEDEINVLIAISRLVRAKQRANADVQPGRGSRIFLRSEPNCEQQALKRDEIKLNRHRALASCLSMIFSENRFTLFRIML